MKKIPYGVADYEKIFLEHYYYIDKTPYLPVIEDAGDYLFFIRPRRFGKSLFLSTMETYYDILKKDQFDFFYKGTYIHRNPTEEKNKYLIMKFNFSAVDPRPKNLETSFLNNIQTIVKSFLLKYSDYLVFPARDELRNELGDMKSAADILFKVIQLCRDSKQKSYIFIDEYDNFANTILSTTGSEAYENLTRGEGFFRAFFNVLKDGTSGSGAPISRLFITGVSPITMDDVTSGFNIGKNVSLLPGFNRMLGFNENDVIEIIEYYKHHGMIRHDTRHLLKIITAWYGNYCFSEDDTVKMYNPDMVLYFVDNYLMGKKLPRDLIDRNVRVDYGKLRHLILVDKREINRRDKDKSTNGNFNRLKEILQKGQTSCELVKYIPLEQLTDTNNFTSLLFYFGLLTIQGPDKDKLLLTIPNETVKWLYYNYINEAYRETHIFDLDLSRYADLMTGMAYDDK